MIKNNDLPAPVINYFLLAQFISDKRDARAVDAEKTGYLFLCQREFITAAAILKHQEPTAKTLLYLVIIITNYSSGNLFDVRISVIE